MVALAKSQDKIAQALELVGSWTVNVGDQDQALHLWRYKGGFEAIDNVNRIFSNSEVSGDLFRNVFLSFFVFRSTPS